jgi:hypothetical protein
MENFPEPKVAIGEIQQTLPARFKQNFVFAHAENSGLVVEKDNQILACLPNSSQERSPINLWQPT